MLKGQIAEAIDKLDFANLEERNQAMRQFVERTLVWQFGEEILRDPKFSTLVDEVSEVLLTDPASLEGLKASIKRK